MLFGINNYFFILQDELPQEQIQCKYSEASQCIFNARLHFIYKKYTPFSAIMQSSACYTLYQTIPNSLEFSLKN